MKFSFSFIMLCLFFSVFSQETTEKKTINLRGIIEKKSENYFNILDYLVKIDLSNQQLEQIISVSKKDNYPLLEIAVLNIIGGKYRKVSEFESSIDMHQKALKLSEQIKNKEAQIHSLNMLGVCYHWNLDVRNAIDYHQKTLAISGEIENPSDHVLFNMGIAQNSVGVIYRELKQYKIAIEQFKQAIQAQKKINNLEGLAVNYSCIGDTYQDQGLFEKAMLNYNKSLIYNKKVKSKLGKVICSNSIASVLIEQGNYEQAKETIESIYFDALDLNSKKHIAKTLATLGRVQQKLGNLEASETNLLKAFNISKNLIIKAKDYINLCFYLSDLYELKHDYKQALFFEKLGVEQEHRTSGQQNILYVSNLIAKYDSQIKKIKIKQLEEQTKLQSFETSRTRNILIIILVSLTLLSVALYSIYRQRLLNNDKKVLTLEQQALQAQMNPHFLFNALNSIKLYIINNEQRQAVYYLNKFSKLIRNILDTSRKKEVTLQEELETMDLYVAIENIRFNKEIKYSNEITDSTLKIDTIKIPPLLLQPFLENAIWHGLSSKEGTDKQVKLIVSKIDENLLEISISDNGVGRKKAMNIKKSKSLKRKSVGIDLTKDRLKTFASDYITDSYVQYHDLLDDLGNPLGTKVVLGIPMK